MKMKGVEGEKDQFERLPDALIVVIFNKLVDVKTLFRCFSVCKRFASLVPQTDTIFIPLPFPKNHHPILVRFQNLVSSIVAAVPFRFLFNGIVPASWSPSSSSSFDHDPDRAISELHKFTAIRSLVIELYDYKDRGLWVRHKAIIGARFEILVSFFASALLKIDDNATPSSSSSTDLDDVFEEEMNTRSCLDQALVKHRLAQRLICMLPALCELVFGDRIFNGKMCMGKEQIREVRNFGGTSSGVKLQLISPSEVIGGSTRGVKVKKWRVPMLEVPSCGRVMEKVTIAVVRREDDDEETVMERDLGFILGGFGDDQEGKVVDEVLNVVRQKMIDDHDAAASIKMHRLEFVQDRDVFC